MPLGNHGEDVLTLEDRLAVHRWNLCAHEECAVTAEDNLLHVIRGYVKHGFWLRRIRTSFIDIDIGSSNLLQAETKSTHIDAVVQYSHLPHSHLPSSPSTTDS